MLKELYKESIEKCNPDAKLLESTKSAMYETLSTSDSINRKALFSASATPVAVKNKVPQYKKLAAACAIISLVVGIGAVCAIVTSQTNSNLKNDDIFASSGYSAFEGDSPNGGDDSAAIVITTTTTQNSVTTVSTTHNEEPVQQTTAATQITTTVTQAQTVATTTTTTVTKIPQQIVTTTVTTADTTVADITTTTTAQLPEMPPEMPGDFGYYDPQYDPQFKDEFDPNREDEFLFEHENIYYYFDCHKSDKVMLKINGEDISLRHAIDQHRITPEELLEFEGFICKGYYNDNHYSEPIEIHRNTEERMCQSGGFMNYNSDSGQQNAAPEDQQQGFEGCFAE